MMPKGGKSTSMPTVIEPLALISSGVCAASGVAAKAAASKASVARRVKVISGFPLGLVWVQRVVAREKRDSMRRAISDSGQHRMK